MSTAGQFIPTQGNISAHTPLVSVCMITYNHSEFIAQAIESVLAQETDFSFELVIGEDHSTDGTADIIRKYAHIRPELIRARYNDQNMGMMPNFLKTFSECKGKYIAMLEGDDYWTDPHKLKKQIAFLQANPSFCLCFHPIQVLENGRLMPDDRFTRNVSEVTDIRELASGNYLHTCSVMYRAECLADLPESLNHSPAGDYFLHMLAARHGPIGKLPDTMAVYRVHSGGVWSGHQGIENKVLTYLECMIGHFPEEIERVLILRHQTVSSRYLFQNAGEPAFEDNFRRCLRYGDARFLIELRQTLIKYESLRKTPLCRIQCWLSRFLSRD